MIFNYFHHFFHLIRVCDIMCRIDHFMKGNTLKFWSDFLCDIITFLMCCWSDLINLITNKKNRIKSLCALAHRYNLKSYISSQFQWKKAIISVTWSITSFFWRFCFHISPIRRYSMDYIFYENHLRVICSN